LHALFAARLGSHTVFDLFIIRHGRDALPGPEYQLALKKQSQSGIHPRQQYLFLLFSKSHLLAIQKVQFKTHGISNFISFLFNKTFSAI
jgi:hypothetical protein